MVSTECIARKFLLAKGALWDASIILPAHNRLLNFTTLVALSSKRPSLTCTRLNLICRQICKGLRQAGQPLLESGYFQERFVYRGFPEFDKILCMVSYQP